MKIVTSMIHKGTLYIQMCCREAKNTKMHINQCKQGISLKHKKITLIENVVIYYQYNYL